MLKYAFYFSAYAVVDTGGCIGSPFEIAYAPN